MADDATNITGAFSPNSTHLEGYIMLGNTILSQTTQNQESPDPTNAQAWLQAKVAEYQAEVTRLEAQLKHAQVLLRGHQIWLDEVKRKAGQQ